MCKAEKDEAKRRRWVPLLALAALVTAPHASAETAGKIAKLDLVPPCAALVTAAASNDIALGQFDPISTTNVLRAGDSVAFLGTFVRQRKTTQWLLYVRVTTPEPPAKAGEKPEPMTVNLFGTPIQFEPKPVPARLRLLGPFGRETAGAAKPKESSAEFTLNESFLSLGLESGAEVLRRWSLENTQAPAGHGSATNGPAAKQVKPPLEEQRAVAGSIPALISYLEIVQHVDGLEGILWKLIKLPSFWSMVKDRGIDAGLSFGGDDDPPPRPANPQDWNLPSSMPVFYFPCLLTLNQQPSIKITLVVTKPQPPRLACGGIVGLLAEKVGDDQTYLTLRIVSARRAGD